MNTSRYNLVLSSQQKIYAGASVGDAKLTKDEKAKLKTFEKLGFYGDKKKPAKPKAAQKETQPKDESKDESKDDAKLSRADRLKANSQN